jgi:hypothetical protein
MWLSPSRLAKCEGWKPMVVGVMLSDASRLPAKTGARIGSGVVNNRLLRKCRHDAWEAC